MAVSARLMAGGSAVLLGGVAPTARLGLRAGVRLVAAGALSVTAIDLRVLGLVAARAAGEQRFGSMRQTAVTTLTSRVPGVAGRVCHFGSMTALADLALVQLLQEVVRLVALHASDAGVAGVIGARELMAIAAGFRGHVGLHRLRMRVVAAHARAHLAALRVIRMHVRVAALASVLRRGFHVVRRVAARASAMCRHLGFGQHVLVTVTATAAHGGALLEAVGPVTSDAFTVPAFEQRARRHDRLVARVTVHARGSGVQRRGVLVLVARLADLRRRLVRGRV